MFSAIDLLYIHVYKVSNQVLFNLTKCFFTDAFYVFFYYY